MVRVSAASRVKMTAVTTPVACRLASPLVGAAGSFLTSLQPEISRASHGGG